MIYRVEFDSKFYLVRAADDQNAVKLAATRHKDKLEYESQGPVDMPRPTDVSTVTTRGPLEILAEGHLPTNPVSR